MFCYKGQKAEDLAHKIQRQRSANTFEEVAAWLASERYHFDVIILRVISVCRLWNGKIPKPGNGASKYE